MRTSSIKAVVPLSRGRRRLKRPPRQQHPRGMEREYYRRLISIVQEARRMIEDQLLPRLPSIVREAGLVQDAAEPVGYTRTVSGVFEDIRVAYYQEGARLEWRNMAKDIGEGVSTGNRRQVLRQFKSVLGTDPFLAEPWLEQLAGAFTQENVGLIKSIPDRYFQEIEDSVNRGVRAGRRHEDIAKDIRAKYSVSKKRAALIARDQVSKFNGDLTHARQTDLGVTRYRWRTSKDERVRKGHRRLEGLIQRWSKPPVVDQKSGRQAHPGGDFQCRCTAEPIIEDLLGLPAEEEKKKIHKAPAQKKSKMKAIKKVPTRREKTVDSWVDTLTDDQRGSIESWSAYDYADIRAIDAFEGEVPEGLFNQGSIDNLKQIKKALVTAPNYKGTIYRGIHDLTEAQLAAMTTTGNTIAIDAISSFSKSKKVGMEFIRGIDSPRSVMIEVKLKDGAHDIAHRRLTQGGIIPTEQEVLVVKGKKLRVVEVRQLKAPSGQDWRHVIMEESR